MKITIKLPEELIAAAKKAAMESNCTPGEYIADALRVALDHNRRKVAKRELKLTTYGEGGVMPGVNLDDTSSLLDIMDGIENPDPK